MKELHLSQYTPRSELRVAVHERPLPFVPAIDFHTHWGRLLLGDDYARRYDTSVLVDSLIEKGVKKVVNLDGEWGEHLDRMLDKTRGWESFFVTFGTLDFTKLEERHFESYVRRTLLESREKGIAGLKFWKNISLGTRDKSGRYLPVDDDRLGVIWQTAAELKLPVLIHIADPIAFFHPVDEFNERYEELQAHPDWSFGAPGYYRFEELMDMQESLLRKNPGTTFVVAHFGSCAEDLSFVGRCLDRYPNMYVDMAMRISELGRQPYTAKAFFHKYQDRILFGTDFTPLDCACHSIYYRFLETEDEYFDYAGLPIPNQGRWKIYGLGLEPELLEKIYTRNAEKIIGGK